MKKILQCAALLSLLATLNAHLVNVLAQGTAFMYQGRLNSSGVPASGSFDLQFTLYATSTAGTVLAGPVTNTAVSVTNGLFATLVDFGPGAFTGTSNWLALAVSTNGADHFTTLAPRQQLTPTPYAIYAENANAAGLTGTVPASDLSLTGVSGSGLVGLNASQLTAGTVADARLAADVALTDANQTFTGINTFSTGTGNGQLLVSGNSGISTSLFTGLGLEYYGSSGEGAIMSSYNDGFGYLTFYTKQGGGFPIVQQMQIDRWGGVHIDQQNYNEGLINNGTTNGVGLTFGTASGEGIASQRQPGANQYGLDFYTDFIKRMSITQSGFVGIGTQTPVNPADTQFELYSPTTNGYDGMWIATGAGGLPFYGYSEGGGYTAYTYVDGSDGNKWKVYDGGVWLTVAPSGNVGIGTTTPTETLEINGTGRLDDYDVYLRTGTDRNHGIGYRQSVNGGDIHVDGPFIYGYNGGCLGLSNPDYAALTWDYNGNIWISNNCSVASLTVSAGATFAGNVGIGTNSPTSTLQVNGQIAASSLRAPGAGINTGTFAFIQRAVATNTTSDLTIIYNPVSDGDPNAILIVTHNFSSDTNSTSQYNTKPVGVWYNGAHWTIYNEDVSSMALGRAFNVMVIKH